MKKTKILVPALSVLALGMAASVTGTVAWYAANTQVRGSGMAVSAVVAKNLIISNSAHTVWSAAAVATTTSEVAMSPVSTTTGNFDDNSKYFAVVDGSKVDATSGRAKNGCEFSAPITGALAEGYNGVESAKYVRMDTFFVSLQAKATDKINLRLTVSTDTVDEEITKALRFGLKYGLCTPSGTWGFSGTATETLYSATGGDASYNGISQAGTVQVGTGAYDPDSDAVSATTEYMNNQDPQVALTSAVSATTTLPSATVVQENFAGGQYLKLEIYTWYEGQDAACTSGNSIDQEVLNINIMFDYANA